MATNFPNQMTQSTDWSSAVSGTASEKSVLVSGIPEGVSKDQLIIHFQKRKYGGGDIEHAIYPLEKGVPGKALIIFRDLKAAATVMEYPHEVNGAQLTLRPFPKPIFSSVEAVINPEFMENFSNEECFDLVRQLENDCCVQTQTTTDGQLHLLGNWFQLQNAYRLLRRVTNSPKPQQPPRREFSTSNQETPVMKPYTMSSHLPENQDPSAKYVEILGPLETELLKYIFCVYHSDMREIEECVTIEEQQTVLGTMITMTSPNQDLLLQMKKRFLDFYEACIKSVRVEKIPCDSKYLCEPYIKQAIADFNHATNDITIKIVSENEIRLVAKADVIYQRREELRQSVEAAIKQHSKYPWNPCAQQ